jgi:hypothetical protein
LVSIRRTETAESSWRRQNGGPQTCSDVGEMEITRINIVKKTMRRWQENLERMPGNEIPKLLF